jgi:hypothetical protein
VEQLDDSSAEYSPAFQLIQEVAPVEEKVPAEHLVHTELPSLLENLPTKGVC